MENKVKISVLLGIMCMFLTMGIVIQIKTVSNSTTTVGKTLVENSSNNFVSVLQNKAQFILSGLNCAESEQSFAE